MNARCQMEGGGDKHACCQTTFTSRISMDTVNTQLRSMRKSGAASILNHDESCRVD